MESSPVIEITPLGFPWPTLDPFLFCAYHRDDYPRGDEQQGVDPASLAGRSLGSDFELRDGFRMYHGQSVPGFPRHPHRGFETITVLEAGYCDHSDSMGATARFGPGDMQWMTAGNGIEHAEMFPLRASDRDNPLELFQIWLNLPARSKRVPPYFSMYWQETIPRRRHVDEDGKATDIVYVVGGDESTPGAPPPPDSYANTPNADIAVWLLYFEAGARFTLPATDPGTQRALYVVDGGFHIEGADLPNAHRGVLHADRPAELTAGETGARALLLQGRPIGEPVVQHGPFVMNTAEEIREAFFDYQRDQFGLRWPWPDADPVHPRDQGRFARHADGRLETPAKKHASAAETSPRPA